jgi:hypothetical protein
MTLRRIGERLKLGEGMLVLRPLKTIGPVLRMTRAVRFALLTTRKGKD